MASYVTARQPSFARGLNDASAPEEYAASEVAEMLDCRLGLAGNGATRRGGSKRLHPSALNGGATVYGLREFMPAADVYTPPDGAALRLGSPRLSFGGSGRENLIRDAAMDTDSDGDGVVDGFQVGQGPGSWTASLDETEDAQRFDHPGDGNSTEYRIVQRILRVFGGDEITFTVEAKTTADAGLRVQLRWHLADGTNTFESLFNGGGGTASFTRLGGTTTAPEDAVSVDMWCGSVNWDETVSNSQWWRNARLLRASSDPSAWSNPHVDGGAQSVTSLTTAGWPADTEGVVTEGDWVRIGGSGPTEADADDFSPWYVATADADSDGDGKATLALEPRQTCIFVGDEFHTAADDGNQQSRTTRRATGLPTDYWSMVVTDACGTPTLYAANGESVYQWDGSTWSTVSNAPSGVKYLSIFGGRLYAAGHDGETVQATAVEDFTVWDTTKGALSVKVATHDGDTEITGLYQLGEAVLVFKQESTAYIAGYGQETLTVETGPEGGVSRSVGCRGFRTIRATAEDAVVWLSERGFELYRLGGQIQLIGRPTQGFLDGLNHDRIKNNRGVPVAAYWPRKNEYWCAVPEGDSTENDRIWVFRPPGGATSPARWIFRPSFPVSTLAVSSRSGEGRMPYGGGYDGFVRALETGEDGDRDSDDTGGSTVTARLQSRPLTFGEQQIEKRGRVVRGGVTAPSEATVTYHAVADGSVNAGRGVTHPASSGPVSKKARVSARGYVLGVRAEWSDPGLTLQALQMEAKPLRKGW